MDAVATVDVVVEDCNALFEQMMEVITTLHEDPNLQRLNTEVRELQQQYDEARVMTLIDAISHRLAKMHKEKKLLQQVEVAQQKEAVLKAKFRPWLDEAQVIIAAIEEKLVGLQRTQQKVKEHSAGPVTKQLVKKLKQAATQITTEVEVAQVKLGGLHTKISMTTQ